MNSHKMWLGVMTIGIALTASVSTPLVGTSLRDAHAATPAFELAVDCDITTPGIQASCDIPVSSTSAIPVAVVVSNYTGATVTIAAFNYDLYNPNAGGSGTLVPGAPVRDPANFPEASWSCLPAETADTGSGAGGTTTSFVSCFVSNASPGDSVASGASLHVSDESFADFVTAPATVVLTLSQVSVADDTASTLLSCDPAAPPPADPTGNVAGACFPATLNFTTGALRASGPTVTATAVPTSTSVVPTAEGPTPTAAAPKPMELVPEEVRRAALDAPTVDDGSGPRQEGMLVVTSSLQFDTGELSVLDPDAQLIADTHWDQFGVRVLVVTTLDAKLDQLIIKLQGMPSIIDVGKNWMHSLLDVPPNDPYWPGQYNAGLALFNLAELWSYSTGSPNVHVAVLDSGVNEIPDLQAYRRTIHPTQMVTARWLHRSSPPRKTTGRGSPASRRV